MKQYIKINLLIISILFTNTLLAQVNNNGIYFQAIARDNFTNPAKERKLYIESSIIQSTESGNKVFTELHQANTDAFGVFNITIGGGKWVSGVAKSLTRIDWANGPFFLNIKISIAPVSPPFDWDYTKDWVDLGTTPFGTVPYALYSANSVDVSNKLSIADTAKMLANYLKSDKLNLLSIDFDKKLSSTDTAAMLLPYKNIIHSLANGSTILDSTLIKVNTELNSKINSSDSATIFVTPYQLAAKTYDTSFLNNRINLKINLADSILAYVTPSQLASKTFDITPINTIISTKLNLTDTITLSNRINLKLSTSDTATMLNNRISKDTSFLLQKRDTATLSTRINLKLSSLDTTAMLNNRMNKDTSFLLQKRDTASLSTRINSKMDTINKSINLSLTSEQNNIKFPTALAVTTYVTQVANTITAGGASPATAVDYGLIKLAGDLTNTPDYPVIKDNAITSSKIFDGTIATADLADASITNIKISSGISKSKVGLSNVTDNAQIYSLTTIGASGAATFSSTTGNLNVPIYTLTGLGGQTQLNGTGLVKATGTSISYDNTTYLNSTDTTFILANRLKISDTASMLITRLKVSDTASMLTTRLKVSDTANMLTTRLKVSDTASMLTTRLKVSDTASMLSNRLKISDSASMLTTRLKFSDTASMLTTRLKVSDTANMLTTRLKVSDTASMLTSRLKINDTASMLANRLKISDTASMLTTRLKVSDTASMLTTRIKFSDTASMLSNRLKISDTASMLTTRLKVSDTANMLTTRLKVSDTASMLTTRLKVSDTASMLANRLKISDTSNMLTTRLKVSDTASMLTTRLKVSDTASMLSNRLKISDTSNMLITRLKVSDTASMLANRLKISDTANMLTTRLKVSDTANMLTTRLKVSDTASMLSNRLKISDTASMLSNRLKISDTSNMLTTRLKVSDTASMLTTRLKVSDTSTMLSLRFARDTVTLSNRINLKLDKLNPTITGLTIADSIKATRYSSSAQPGSITAASPTNINLSLGNIFTVAMGTTISSLTFTNPAIGTYLIKFVQDATGNREVTAWPANLKWAGGAAPAFTNAGTKIDIVTLIYDGTNYYGAIVQNF